MTNSQKLAVRSSEIRSRLNDLSGMPTAGLTDELRAETDALTTEYRDVESQYRAALVAEGDDAEQRAANKGGVNEDSETRERRALRGRLRIGNYVGAALEMRGAVGAGTGIQPGAQHRGQSVPVGNAGTGRDRAPRNDEHGHVGHPAALAGSAVRGYRRHAVGGHIRDGGAGCR